MTTPEEFIQRGLVTRKEIKEDIDRVRSLMVYMSAEFPNATFVIDSDNILRIEANEGDAGEIDFTLHDVMSVFTPFSIQVRS